MAKNDILIIADYSNENRLSFDELCELCRTSPDFIYTLIELEIITPQANPKSEQWEFDLAHLERIKKALRLHHDLEVNMQGVALIIDLLDQIDDLRARAALLEKHLLK